jgi:hypothetical protein
VSCSAHPDCRRAAHLCTWPAAVSTPMWQQHCWSMAPRRAGCHGTQHITRRLSSEWPPAPELVGCAAVCLGPCCTTQHMAAPPLIGHLVLGSQGLACLCNFPPGPAFTTPLPCASKLTAALRCLCPPCSPAGTCTTSRPSWQTGVAASPWVACPAHPPWLEPPSPTLPPSGWTDLSHPHCPTQLGHGAHSTPLMSPDAHEYRLVDSNTASWALILRHQQHQQRRSACTHVATASASGCCIPSFCLCSG